MRIHFLVNPNRLDAVHAAVEAISFVQARGAETAADRESEASLGIPSVPREQFGDADLVICFGGDGTLIRGASACSERGTPLLGVYFGRFGFVTQCAPEGLSACLTEFFAGTAQFEERMMLQVDLVRTGETVAELHALNEVSLQRSPESRMMTFSVKVDDVYLTRYPADGLLASTPTGSTAYNLSAGGPILDPQLQAIVFSAIAPHTLSARPLVLHGDSTLELGLGETGEAMLSVDGLSHMHAVPGDKVRVRRSPRVTRLLSASRSDFLEKLGKRLFWSFSIMGSEP